MARPGKAEGMPAPQVAPQLNENAVIWKIMPGVLMSTGAAISPPAPHHFRKAVAVRHDLGRNEVTILSTISTGEAKPRGSL